MTINIEEFLETLPIMLKGMGGIYIVTAAIILMMLILRVCTSDREE